MRHVRRGGALVASILLGVALSRAAAEGNRLGEAEGGFRPVAVGTLAGVTLPDTLSAREREYLGLEAGAPFSVGAVRGELVVVELFNSSCHACALMAPVMGEVWGRIDARPDLGKKVRFVGIGVGNTRAQVREFHSRYATPFPMVADPEFVAFDAFGTAEGTPYLLLLRRGLDGTLTALGQVGHIPDAGRVVAEIEAALAGAGPGDATPRPRAGSGWRMLEPQIPQAELEARLTAAAAAAGLTGARATPVPSASGESFYRLAAGDASLWALVAGRSRVCNVCHDIFFIVVFDGDGRIVNLAPITITKAMNVELDAEDVAFLKRRVVGRLLSRDIVFDPSVDAVTAATMSSALVFDTLRRLKETWAEVVERTADHK